MERYYVAYGSNLNLEQMEYRYPTAEVFASGILNNWELIFRGSKTGAYATIRRKKGSMVPVVMWKIQEQDERHLDIYEGFPTSYSKMNVMVDLPNGKKKGMVYVMNKTAKPGTPSNRYVQTVMQGYIDNDLDLSYLYEAIRFNRFETK